MIGVLVVTHGALAEELLAAVARVAGCPPRAMRALALDWSVGLDEASRQIGHAIDELDSGAGVLVLTDMFGDTPSNAALACCRTGRIEMISGVNLPMLVRLACTNREQQSLSEVARWLVEKGKSSIRRGGGRVPKKDATGGERGG